MPTYFIAIAALFVFASLSCAQAQEDIQKMSNEELAEYFMVKACSANLYVTCANRKKIKDTYNTPEVRNNALSINQRLDYDLHRQEIDYAVNTLGLNANQARQGYMVKECGWFSCSWVYKGGRLPIQY
jgi:hypothetical protein